MIVLLVVFLVWLGLFGLAPHAIAKKLLKRRPTVTRLRFFLTTVLTVPWKIMISVAVLMGVSALLGHGDQLDVSPYMRVFWVPMLAAMIVLGCPLSALSSWLVWRRRPRRDVEAFK